jgi:hypothetical protein
MSIYAFQYAADVRKQNTFYHVITSQHSNVSVWYRLLSISNSLQNTLEELQWHSWSRNSPRFVGCGHSYPFQNLPSLFPTLNQKNSINKIFVNILLLHLNIGGTRWRSSLRHCATNRNVAGSIPDGVTGSFHWHNRFGRIMALGSTQPLTEYQESFLGGKGGRCVGLTTLPSSCADCLKTLGASTSWNSKGLSRSVMGLLYLYI